MTPEDNLTESSIVGSDPPVLVGGGGSTWVWIRKDQAPKPVDPKDLPAFPDPPDPATMPKHPEDYLILHLENFTVSRVHVHDGQVDKSKVPIPNNPNAKKKHRTFFD